MNKILRKGLLCFGLSVISASAFAAQTFTVVRSNNSGFIISHIGGTGGSLPSGGSTISALQSPDALPTVNDILTLRGPGYGNGAGAHTVPALTLLPLLNEQVSTTNGGKGNFSTLGFDTALLSQARGN